MAQKTVLFFAAAMAASISIPPAGAQDHGRVFELRPYTCNEGKLPDLLARFRNHTTRIFEKHGMTNIAYWVPQDSPASQNTLIYVIAHASREAAKRNWDEFRQDPEWQKVQKDSEANGKLVSKVESKFFADEIAGSITSWPVPPAFLARPSSAASSATGFESPQALAVSSAGTKLRRQDRISVFRTTWVVPS